MARPCSICTHPERLEIDRLLLQVADQGLRLLAASFIEPYTWGTAGQLVRCHVLVLAVANEQYIGRNRHRFCHRHPELRVFANLQEKCYKDGGPRAIAAQAQCLDCWFKHSIGAPIAEVDNLTFSPSIS